MLNLEKFEKSEKSEKSRKLGVAWEVVYVVWVRLGSQLKSRIYPRSR